jgi:CelD/BcsL family acetyltransferase involved in cellulose biosynthesis
MRAETNTGCVVDDRASRLSEQHALTSISASPSTRTSAKGPIAVSVYRCWAELRAVIPGWEDILKENEALSVFSTPEWLESWWEAFGSNRHLTALAFCDLRGKLLGLIPLYEEQQRARFLQSKCLRFVGDGSGDSDNLDLILRPGFERECCRAFLGWLADHPAWDLCCLNTTPGGSAGMHALLQELAVAKWPSILTETPNAAILLPATWQSYVQSLEGTFRPLVTRYPQRLAQRLQARIYRCEHLEQLSAALDLLFALHQKRWNRAHEPGSFRSYERRQFYRRMAEAFLRKDWLEFWLLELEGNVVAAQFCFRYRESAYLLQEGFDPESAAHRVGYALRATMLERFIRSGVKRYDFLGGFSDHKRNWGATIGAYRNLQFAPPRSLASCRLALNKRATGGKEWLRNRLPIPVWQLLHKMKLKLAGATAELRAD